MNGLTSLIPETIVQSIGEKNKKPFVYTCATTITLVALGPLAYLSQTGADLSLLKSREFTLGAGIFVIALLIIIGIRARMYGKEEGSEVALPVRESQSEEFDLGRDRSARELSVSAEGLVSNLRTVSSQEAALSLPPLGHQ